jgi:hypothetical protein
LLGNDALKSTLGTGSKESRTITDELLAELNAAFVIIFDEMLQD